RKVSSLVRSVDHGWTNDGELPVRSLRLPEQVYLFGRELGASVSAHRGWLGLLVERGFARSIDRDRAREDQVLASCRVCKSANIHSPQDVRVVIIAIWMTRRYVNRSQIEDVGWTSVGDIRINRFADIVT